MSGSDAEERIRAKAEAALRATWPSARIIHELVVAQARCRIDLAAVTADRLILVEVKSERDVLDRLERQLRQARQVADDVIVTVAAKHLEKARPLVGWTGCCDEDGVGYAVEVSARRVHSATTNAPARLDMLWASELRRVAESGGKAARQFSIIRASDLFTGAEVRRRVCAALRARHFPRADPPVLSELFPEVTRGTL